MVPSGVAFARWEYDALGISDIAVSNQYPIKIAIIDSGTIDSDYLRPYIGQGYNFLDNNNDCVDSYGHGTKVTGILVDLARITGLNMELIPLKTVTNEGRSSTDNVIRAINYAVEQDVDIINISMANKNSTPELIAAIQNAQLNNIIIVAGAGNEGQNINLYPASYDNVLSVGSVDKTQNISWFSNYNNKISVVAPGEKITTMELDGSYGLHSGTSFSTPFVTFEVALLKAKYPELSNGQITAIMDETEIDKGDIGKDDYYGNGIVNYKNALLNTNEALQKYKNWTPSTDVALSKPWTITFNDLVKSVGNISIEDEYYNIVPIDIQTSGKTVTITPLEPYGQDAVYSLTINDTVSSTDTALKDNVKMKFKTEKANTTMRAKSHDLPYPMPD
jgi:subtilisin family serine protease